MFLGAISEKAEVTDTHEAIGQDVEQEAADKFLGIEGEGLLPIPVFAISIAQGDQAVLRVEDAVVGERDAVSVAAEVIKHGLWRTERLFRVDVPALLA